MKILIGLLLAGLLAFANAQAQTTQNEEANIAALASQVPAVTRDGPVETKPAQKTPQGVLQAVEAVVASLTPGGEAAAAPTSAPVEHAAEGTRVASPDAPANEAETPAEETSPEAIPDNDEVDTEATPEAEEEEEPVEKPTNEAAPTKKELKAIAKYNEAVDQVAVILSERLKEMGPMPLQLDEATFLALDATAPEPEPDSATTGSLRKNKNKNRKNKNKKNKNRKNQMEETRDDVEETKGNNRKNNNSNEKNNNGNKSNEKNKGGNNNNDSKEKNKNKNKNRNKNKRNRNNKKNKKNSREDGVQRRQPKDYDGDDDDIEDTEDVAQGRRKNGEPQQAHRNKKNRKNKNKNKNRNNKNKKNKNKGNKKNKGREDIESREDEGPTIPTAEERAESNAKLTGFSQIQRHGDVAVNMSGKRHEVSALLIFGPLEVQLKEKSRTLTRAKVNTFMSAVAQFKVKSVRGRSKINLKEITMSSLEPQHVAVTRDDLELEPELISEAQNEVAQAVDMQRIGRILKAELTNIFDKDNIIENLENHPFHKKN